MLTEKLQQQLSELLKKHVIFSVLSEETIEELVLKLEMVSVSMGENIVNEGEPGDCAYLIYAGRVRVFHQANGKPVTLATLSSGDLFGDIAILRDDVRSASVRAADDVVLFRIGREDFQKLLERHAEIRPYFERLMQERSVTDFLRLATFLGQLPAKQVMALLDKLEPRTYHKDEVIFRQGDPGDGLYIIRSGEVRVVAQQIGDEKLLNYLREGDYFGERALILDEPRTASVTATQETACFLLSRDNFETLVGSAPQLKQQLTKRIEQYHVNEELQQKFGLRPPERQERRQLSYRSVEDIQPQQAEEPQRPGRPQKLRRRRGLFRKFPWLRQHDETDCGAACLAMIARYHGIRLAIGRLRELANVGREGASMFSLAEAAEKTGYVTRAVRTDFDHLSGIELPAIAHWKGYHYIVLYQVRGDRVVVADPGIGLITMSRKEFADGWTGRLLLLAPTSRLEENEEVTTTYRRFLPFLHPYRFLLFEVLIASLVLELLQLVSPVFTQFIVDKVLVHQNVSMLNIMLGGMLIVGFFSISTGLLRQYLLIHVSQKLSLRFSSDLFRQILRLPMRFFHTRKIGDLMQRFLDNATIQSILTGTAIGTLLDVMTIFLVVGLMFFYNVKLALVALAAVPFYIALTLCFTPILKRNNQQAFEKAAARQSNLVESLTSVAAIKSCTAENTVRWKHEDLLVQGANVGFRGAKISLAMGGMSSTLQILSSTFMLWYGAHLVIRGELTVGQLMAFQALIGMVMGPIMGLIGLWDQLQEAHLALQRLSQVHDAEPEQPPGKQLVRLPRVRGHVKFENVGFRYDPDGKNILSNIHLEIQPGQTVALVGRSGSGKTTLVTLAQRLFLPTEGRILVDGFDIAAVDIRSLREQMGVVAQQATIFSGTIRENISLTDTEASLERVVWAAQIANAHDFIMSFPLGYDTVVGQMGVQLSGGQQQRISIARALLSDPRIIIFDEATSALDSESEKMIQQNMKYILKGRTAIVVAHRLSTIQNADKIVVLDEGMIIEQGMHRELLDKKGLYYYLNSQQLTG